MDEIRQWQEAFCAALLSPDQDSLLPDLTGPIPGQVSTAIYRNNVLEGFRLALADIYRTIVQLLGEECFRELCRGFVQCHPSLCGDRNAYGQEMANWLTGHPLSHALSYLRDIARLEWAQHEAYQSEDIFSKQGLHASVRLVESEYPVYSIWAFCQDPENAETLDLDRLLGESVLVARPKDEVLMRPLGQAEALWYQALLTGQDHLQASNVVHATELDVDARLFLETAYADGLLVKYQS
ncbi:putative DNA-binding domain-containing protein [Acidithiobacillus sp. MC6.1]|nr:putative DNA-binding domain-containing protein [Acidithiobacillus sp. MC6.1]